MRIRIVTPAPPRTRGGNRTTALRWARLLGRLGHRVHVQQSWRGESCDMLVALHARKSHASILRYRRERPTAPLVVALTGTDVYANRTLSRRVIRSLDLASRIVVLQPLAKKRLPKRLRAKTRTIFQSAEGGGKPEPLRRSFEVCVLGNLRAVKDPLRAARAARRLPAGSRIRIVHAGRAVSSGLARIARRETRSNPRYRWMGELPRGRARRLLARSRLLLLTSRAEGGANVLSEAIALKTPILSSRIPGSVGILGEKYPGMFPVGDTRALVVLLQRAESDPRFYRSLERCCRLLAPLVSPSLERRAWRRLVGELKPQRNRRKEEKAWRIPRRIA